MGATLGLLLGVVTAYAINKFLPRLLGIGGDYVLSELQAFIDERRLARDVKEAAALMSRWAPVASLAVRAAENSGLSDGEAKRKYAFEEFRRASAKVAFKDSEINNMIEKALQRHKVEARKG